MPPTRAAAAPWRAAFLEHLSLTTIPTFTLATLHPVVAAAAATTSSSPSYFPRARTCVFRGMWASGPLPGNPQAQAGAEAEAGVGVYESDLPVFTTDARSGKVGELFSFGSGSGSGSSSTALSGLTATTTTTTTTITTTTGGGGPVEAVFWVDHPQARTQWRMRGRAWVLAGDVDGDGEGPRAVRGVLEGRMRRVGGGGIEGDGGKGRWSFAREVTAHFGNLNPLMRGLFRGPPPGTPLAAYHAGKEELGQRVDDLEDGAARRNFRVVVIVPEEVDQVDLRDEFDGRRWLYAYRGADGVPKLPGGEIIGEWEKVEVWR